MMMALMKRLSRGQNRASQNARRFHAAHGVCTNTRLITRSRGTRALPKYISIQSKSSLEILVEGLRLM